MRRPLSHRNGGDSVFAPVPVGCPCRADWRFRVWVLNGQQRLGFGGAIPGAAGLTQCVVSKQDAEIAMENAWLRDRGRFMTWRMAVLWTSFLTLSFGCVAAWSDSSDGRQPPSPRTFVSPQSCGARTSCEEGYWAFRAPDCEHYGVSHPPGTVVLFEDEAALQCRCRLTWLRTKPDEPPAAKVTCRWIDVDEAREEEERRG